MILPKQVEPRRSPYGDGGESEKSRIVPSAPPQRLPEPPAGAEVPGSPRPRRSGRIALYMGVVALGAAGTFAYAQFRSFTSESIVARDGDASQVLNAQGVGAKLDPAAFKNYGEGRFALAVVGVGGEGHDGAYLTDSIQIFSFDTLNKGLTVTSVPRDLYVKGPSGGRSKINAVYTYAEKAKAGSGPAAIKQVLSQVTGAKITNFALLDFTAMRDMVDALGGITLTAPKALYDPLYPDDKSYGYAPLSVPAGTQKMGGALALKYARSRKTTTDFDRSARQQLVIAAMKEKALSAGVLANPLKVASLISALGKHFRTDLQPGDIKAVLELYRAVQPADTKSAVLNTTAELGLLTSSSGSSAGDISYPVPGLDRFEAVRDWFAANNPDPLLKRELPTVSLVDGGASAVQLKAFADRLRMYGYSVTVAPNRAAKRPSKTEVSAADPASKPFSRNYLGSLLGSEIAAGSSTGADFTVTFVPGPAAPKTTPSAKPAVATEEP